ncbi:hypothetical protein BDV24DRAFT_170395 [Aspergillus arachidicola]|uniref:Uncharacterized protein n=1 Tax=Aspergillus arachidicola TaxID=656916 RepID=A0A5N6XMY9_9EURO|nr:hypothetical protein BDV24DRAFT_170395 [Aspergillus arachidicola]
MEEPRHDVPQDTGQHHRGGTPGQGGEAEGQCGPGSERQTTSKDNYDTGHEGHPGRDTGDSPTDNIVPATPVQLVEMQRQDDAAITSDIAVNKETLLLGDLELKLSPPSPIPGVTMSPTNDDQQSAISVGLDRWPIHLNPEAVADTNPTMGQPMQEFYIHPEDDNQPPSMGTEN